MTQTREYSKSKTEDLSTHSGPYAKATGELEWTSHKIWAGWSPCFIDKETELPLESSGAQTRAGLRSSQRAR